MSTGKGEEKRAIWSGMAGEAEERRDVKGGEEKPVRMQGSGTRGSHCYWEARRVALTSLRMFPR